MNNIDFKSLFESAPGLYLILTPELQIAGASNAYTDATMTHRDEIVGKGLFEVFPDNPDDHAADGVSNLHSSLKYVLKHKETHTMAIQKYDIRRPDGTFEVRYWSPLNKPIMDNSGEVAYIIHNVVDVTEQQVKGEQIHQLNEELTQNKRTHISELEKSNELFQNIFNNNPAAISISTLIEGRIIDSNQSFLTLHGFANKDSVIGKTTKELGIWVDILQRDKMVESLRENKAVFNWEVEIRNQKGEIKWAASSIHIIEVGNTECMLSVSIDITDRKKAEDELKETNNFLDTIFENIPNMLFVKDAKELRFVRFNNAGEKLLGYSRNDLIGKNDYNFFPEEQAEFFISKDREVLDKNELLNIEEEKINTANGERWLHTKKIPINDKKGSPIFLLGISEDITKRKEQEEQLKQHATNLKLANEELEAFSYSVSHDLRAPLRSLEGFSKALLENYEGKFDEDANRWLNFIAENANRMGVLINDILNFSKVSRSNLNAREINMKVLAEEIFGNEKNNYPTKNINFEIRNIPNCLGDSIMFGQVWQNLISNALKYTSKNEEIVILIDSKTENGYHIYSIKDNGVGFDEKYKDKLFGVFQRLHSSEEFEGTGVGLAIVNRIIQKHNGWITAKSDLGKETEFIFAVPINNN